MLRLVIFASFVCAVFGVQTPLVSIKRSGHRIVGGEHTTIDDIPFQVTVRNYGSHRCGGALITSWNIITSGTCLREAEVENISVRAGSTFLDRGGVVFPARDMLEHPKYSTSTIDFDIGVIFMLYPIAYGPGKGRVRLPSPDTVVEAGQMGRVSGWGALEEGGFPSENLQAVDVPIVDREECRELYANVNAITDNMICAGWVGEGGRDACQDDTGGPLMVNGEMVGIVSWGMGCGRPEFPGVYAYIPALRNWFDAVTQ